MGVAAKKSVALVSELNFKASAPLAAPSSPGLFSAVVQCFQETVFYQLLMECVGLVLKGFEFLGSAKTDDIIKAIPFLNLFTVPFYLIQGSEEAKQRISYMATAFKINRIRDGIFWAAKAFLTGSEASSKIR